MRVTLTVLREDDECKIVLAEPSDADLLMVLQTIQMAARTVVDQLVKINAEPEEDEPSKEGG